MFQFSSSSIIWMIVLLFALLIIPGTDYVTSDAFAQYYSKFTVEGESSSTTSVMSGRSVSIGDIDISMAAPLEGSLDVPITIIEFGDF